MYSYIFTLSMKTFEKIIQNISNVMGLMFWIILFSSFWIFYLMFMHLKMLHWETEKLLQTVPPRWIIKTADYCDFHNSNQFWKTIYHEKELHFHYLRCFSQNLQVRIEDANSLSHTLNIITLIKSAIYWFPCMHIHDCIVLS